ncbi:hypothetical protein JRI60_04040 [Archangium violaceum]|uniref:hypothetical protein n=1 Tax=Archangium violaceum TaxID=83451 RepID=UPI00194FDB6D|nr:hypothetical protein [Archangium violaceum]QRN98250.1 hypothetical protein JRI60_04040 [Archangium violaceum]
MRTYSFDHFRADKPEPSVTNPGGARQTPPVEEATPSVPPSAETPIHYGRQHAQTAELYQKHREERELQERLRASEEVQQEPAGGEAPPLEAREPESTPREEPKATQPLELEPESLKGLAQQAVASVLRAAKEAAKGNPLAGAKHLAGDAMSGALRVARGVSARRSASREENSEKTGEQKVSQKRGAAKARGPGKKR